MISLNSLEHTLVVITGANAGIGLELTKLYSEAGVTVLGLDLAIDQLNLPHVTALKFDVSKTQHWDDLKNHPFFSPTELQTRPLSHWYNNAGISGLGKASEQPLEELERVFQVNFWGVVRGSRFAHAVFQVGSHHHGKSLINMASMSGLIPAPMMSAYSSSKAAVINYSLSLQEEEKNIRVHVVNPGFVKTGILTSHETLRLPEWMLKRASDVTKTAKVIVNEVLRGTQEIIPDENGRRLYKLWRLGPGMTRKLSNLLLK